MVVMVLQRQVSRPPLADLSQEVPADRHLYQREDDRGQQSCDQSREDGGQDGGRRAGGALSALGEEFGCCVCGGGGEGRGCWW